MRLSSLFLSLALLASACGKGSVYQEVIDDGATRYFDKAVVQSQVTDGDTTTFTFDPASGPVCLHGDLYNVFARDTGSEGLFIFLQGGGACWSSFCLAITKATDQIPTQLDVLNPDKPTNPLRNWSTIYLPYCDGSMFAGDSTHDDDGDGKIDRYQHGLQNLSAALDVAVKKFPHPKRIVLAGSSGGGYGTILATLLVRARYPDIDLLVFNDSGIGLGKPGDVTFIAKIMDELNIRRFLPKSCPDCIANGHITRLIDWELARDPQLKIAAFSSYQDYIISNIFLQVDPMLFQQTLLAETGALHQKYGGRYQRFLVAGDVHTTLLGTPDGLIGDDLTAVTLPPGFLDKLSNVKLGGIDTTTLRGVTIAAWFQAMLDGSAAWDDRTE